jgi:hypothetical protein
MFILGCYNCANLNGTRGLKMKTPSLKDIKVTFFGSRPGKTFKNEKSLYDNFFSMCSLSLLKPNSDETNVLIAELKNVKLDYHINKNNRDGLNGDMTKLINVKESIRAWLSKRDPNYTANMNKRKGYGQNKSGLEITDTLSSRVQAVWNFLDSVNGLYNAINAQHNQLSMQHYKA